MIGEPWEKGSRKWLFFGGFEERFSKVVVFRHFEERVTKIESTLQKILKK